MASPLSYTVRTLLMSCCFVILGCEKDDLNLDLSDETVYQWIVITKQATFGKDPVTGAPIPGSIPGSIPKSSVKTEYIEIKRETMWLTNSEVHEMNKRAKSTAFKLEFIRMDE